MNGAFHSVEKNCKNYLYMFVPLFVTYVFVIVSTFDFKIKEEHVLSLRLMTLYITIGSSKEAIT